MQVISALVCRDIIFPEIPARGRFAIFDPDFKLRAPKFPGQVWFCHAVGLQLSSKDRSRVPTFGLRIGILLPDGKPLGNPGGEFKLEFDPTRVNDPETHTIWSRQGGTITVPRAGEYTFRVWDPNGNIDVRTKFQVVEDPASQPLVDMPENLKVMRAEMAAKYPPTE
jgi:hypothetical protein